MVETPYNGRPERQAIVKEKEALGWQMAHDEARASGDVMVWLEPHEVTDQPPPQIPTPREIRMGVLRDRLADETIPYNQLVELLKLERRL